MTRCYRLYVFRSENWTEEWQHRDLAFLLRVKEKLEADGAVCEVMGW